MAFRLQPPDQMMWPDGMRSAVALTFDLDIETPFANGETPVARRPGLGSQAQYAAKVGVPLILSLLEQLEVDATFFVPGKSAEDFPETVRSIAVDHEIASHGYTHEAPSSMGREREEEELLRTLEILASFGVDVAGYRAPFFEPSAHTVELLDRYGLRYSSGLMDDIRPYRHPGTGVIELPSQWLFDDWSQFGHGYDDVLARNATCSHVRQLWMEEFTALHQLGGLMVITMHPQVIGRPSRIQMLADVVSEMKSHDGVWFANCRMIADHAARVL
ncbi:polysaccharide deacetylase family protein [bacterium]|nr:polysaccharide deacetylase family protein [bacterium]